MQPYLLLFCYNMQQFRISACRFVWVSDHKKPTTCRNTSDDFLKVWHTQKKWYNWLFRNVATVNTWRYSSQSDAHLYWLNQVSRRPASKSNEMCLTRSGRQKMANWLDRNPAQNNESQPSSGFHRQAVNSWFDKGIVYTVCTNTDKLHRLLKPGVYRLNGLNKMSMHQLTPWDSVMEIHRTFFWVKKSRLFSGSNNFVMTKWPSISLLVFRYLWLANQQQASCLKTK